MCEFNRVQSFLGNFVKIGADKDFLTSRIFGESAEFVRDSKVIPFQFS